MATKKKTDWKKVWGKAKEYGSKTLETSKEGYKKLDKSVRKLRENQDIQDEEYNGGLGLFR